MGRPNGTLPQISHDFIICSQITRLNSVVLGLSLENSHGRLYKKIVKRELTITPKSHNNNFPSVVFTLLRCVYGCLWPVACVCVRACVCLYIYIYQGHHSFGSDRLTYTHYNSIRNRAFIAMGVISIALAIRKNTQEIFGNLLSLSGLPLLNH